MNRRYGVDVKHPVFIMADAHIIKTELRTIETDIQRMVVCTVYVDLTSSQLGSSTYLTTSNPSLLQGSMIVTGYNTTSFPTESPMLLNTQYRLEDSNLYLYRFNIREVALRKSGSNVYSVSYNSKSGIMPLFIVSTDEKHYLAFWIPNSTIAESELTSIVQCTDTTFGYFVTDYVGMGMSDIISLYTDSDVEYLFTKSKIHIPSTDPYDAGGTSGGGGGTGDFDNTSDTIGIPALPSESGLNTGFFTAFVCSPSEMRQLSSYLWNNAITDILDPQQTFGEKIDALKKIVGNPYDAIMGCSLVPVSPSIAGSKEVKMYGVIETGLNFSYASSRWVAVDCGTLNINEYWGGYLDYSPYSKTTSLYLPFIGVVSIDIDLIMGKALQVVYHVDILSGICIAFIVVDGSVKFQYQGHCSTTIPITNADYSGAIQSGLGLVGNVANIVTSGVGGAVTGGVAGAVTGAVGSAMSQAPSIASNVMGMKPDIKSGGGVGSSGGILSVKKPYLIIERPRQSLPAYQNTYTGYPCNVTMSVGDCSGYTEYETINLDGLFLTDSEKAELESILKGGVYL